MSHFSLNGSHAMLAAARMALSIAGYAVRVRKIPCRRKASSPSSSSSLLIRGTIPAGGHGVAVSQYAELEKTFSQQDVNLYADLVGDPNMIHKPMKADTEFPAALWDMGLVGGEHSRPIVHGMLVASLFSSVFGTLVPGAVYRSQSLLFQKPVFVDETVIARIEIKKVKAFLRAGGVLVQCDTIILKCNEDDGNDKDVESVSGEAQVWLPGGTKKNT